MQGHGRAFRLCCLSAPATERVRALGILWVYKTMRRFKPLRARSPRRTHRNPLKYNDNFECRAFDDAGLGRHWFVEEMKPNVKKCRGRRFLSPWVLFELRLNLRQAILMTRNNVVHGLV